MFKLSPKGFLRQINSWLETLLLNHFRLVSKRDALMQSQKEENKVRDKESKREQKEKLKWYHNLFRLNCLLHSLAQFFSQHHLCMIKNNRKIVLV